MRKNSHRLVPLETLYPNHPPREQPKNKPKLPFYKPGVSASIPEKAREASSVRYLQAYTIKKELSSLEQPLKDIEDDAEFIANSMNAALQVPKAIEMTFNRIHGRIYDIQREIEYSSNTKDDKALIIQNNFRMAINKQHLFDIKNAIYNTIRRDCSSIHQSLLGFLLSYAKADDHFKMLLNRRFLVRNRNALKHWREWSIQSKELEEKQIAQIDVLQKNWLNRICSNLMKKWKWLSYSKHSRKALKDLQLRITAEAQKRLEDRQAQMDSDDSSNQPIFELLAAERENVIIDYGRQNYSIHMKRIVFKFWRYYVDQCRNESRSDNAIAREFYINKLKRSFFNAWFSLSVGRIVIFGGYNVWHRPENRRLTNYQVNYNIKSKIFKSWRWLCVRRQRMMDFKKMQERKFLRKCLLEFHKAAIYRRESLSQMVENYINFLHMRLHKVFIAWHCYTVKERVRKQPSQFMLNRSILMRKYRLIRQAFRRWNVRFLTRQTARFQQEAKDIQSYTQHWASAGSEMKESMSLISQLNTKLASELEKRKADLNKSLATTTFMKMEQKSLAFEMQNMQAEIERLHSIIGKSSMRYFVDIKPIHGNVVKDVPGALKVYLEQKEQEKQRLLQQKQAQQAQITAQKQKAPPTKSIRRKTAFIHPSRSKLGSPTKATNKIRKSTGATILNETIEENDNDEEEE
ncbi:hypothetical protein M9Y10_038313 [Tritrichomonas musculus]|uniref:IQ calmodulin-binding motif family protein n=1 Tax=Tritrichomonas musculus TaxID=1915356 RepID=A0ABR2K854_9EUKA